jgi:hypothetical protein
MKLTVVKEDDFRRWTNADSAPDVVDIPSSVVEPLDAGTVIPNSKNNEATAGHHIVFHNTGPEIPHAQDRSDDGALNTLTAATDSSSGDATGDKPNDSSPEEWVQLWLPFDDCTEVPEESN